MFNIGKQIRVVKEALTEGKDSKSKNGPTTDGFVATNTNRCDQIVEQLAPMERQLKAYIKELNAFKPCAQELFTSTSSVMSARSPMGGHMAGDTTPVDLPAGNAPSALGHIVGNNPMSRLDTTVIMPCERWLAEFHTAKTERMPMMEKVRLELDSRRRQEIELKDGLSDLRSEAAPTDASKLDKHNREHEQAAERLAHKQGKLMGVHKTFEDQEAAMYQHLRALQQDAELIPAYMAETLSYFKDMFERALMSLPHGSRGIPATTALEKSNHDELWRQANTPNVIPPVMPVPVPTNQAHMPAAAPGAPLPAIPFEAAHTPAAADVASDNHGMLRDITKDRPFREADSQVPHHANFPPTRQYEVEAPRNEGGVFPDTHEGHRTPYDSHRAPAHYVNEPFANAMPNTSPHAMPNTSGAPTPAYTPHHEAATNRMMPDCMTAPTPQYAPSHQHHNATIPPMGQYAAAPVPVMHEHHEQHAAVRPQQNEDDLARMPIAVVHKNL